MATQSEKVRCLRLFDKVCKTTGMSAADAARELGVSPGAVYKWREAEGVPECHLDRVRKWAKDRLDDAEQDSRPGPGAPWIHTTPKKIMAWRTKHGFNEAGTARRLGVAVGTLRNWTLHGKSAMERMQLKVAEIMSKYDAEQEFVAGSFAGKREIAEKSREFFPDLPTDRRDKLATVLFEFCEEDGIGPARAAEVVSEILKLLEG